MLIERQTLETRLNDCLKEIGLNKAQLQKLKMLSIQEQMMPGDIQKIVNNGIDGLHEKQLYKLCKLLFRIFKNDMINPNNIFSIEEINEFGLPSGISSNVQKLYPVYFNSVLQISDQDYLTIIDIKQLVRLYEQNLLVYNFSTQRNHKVKKSRSHGEIWIPRINRKSVNDIKTLLVQNLFLSDTITFNVVNDNNANLQYISDQQRLIIKSGEINILDGFHRLSAAMKAYYEYPGIDLKWQLSIKHYDVITARRYIAQINTMNKVPKKYLAQLKEVQ